MPSTSDDSDIWAEFTRLLPAWSWRCDAEYRVTEVQDRLTELTGIPTEALIGLCLTEGPKNGSERSGWSAYGQALKSQDVIQGQCYQVKLLSGEESLLMDHAVPQYDAQHRFTGYRGVSINLSTIFKQAEVSGGVVSDLVSRTADLERTLSLREASLAESNRLLSEILDAMGEGVMVTSGTKHNDPDNKILMVNPAYLDLFDLRPDQLPKGLAIPDFLQLLQNDGKSVELDPTLEDLDAEFASGSRILMRLPHNGRYVSTTAKNRPSGGYVLVHTDVTELQTQNDALRSARDAAQVANQSKSNFLATMSHEIRTPMNGVVGMADLLQSTDLTNEQSEYVETIRNSALALTRLISDILDFSKIEAGKMEIISRAFDLHDLVAELCDLIRPMARAKGLVFASRIAPGVPRIIQGDPLRLRQILLNFLGNAVKFTERGEISLTMAYPQGLEMVVADTGIGIPEEKLSYIFNAFEQVQTGQSREYEGSGLGLSISRQLIAAMNGRVSVRSKLGQGTQFSICLPLLETQMPAQDIEEARPRAVQLEGRRILVVEDNKTNQLVAQRMLEKIGAQVMIADNGQQAIDMFAPNLYDLVLMDISMPVMSGLEACRHIRDREAKYDWPRCPIVALTGNAFEKDQFEARLAGMDDFLTKPIRRDDLVATLSSHLGMQISTAQDKSA